MVRDRLPQNERSFMNISSSTVPLKLSAERSSTMTSLRFTSEDGIGTMKLLWEKSKTPIRVRFPSDEEIELVNLEACRFKTFKFFRLSIPMGNSPKKLVEERSNETRRLVQLAFGRVPVRSVYSCKFRYLRLGKWKICSENVIIMHNYQDLPMSKWKICSFRN